MTIWVTRSFRTLALLNCLIWAGCLPPAQSQLDEEKEPHFLAGKARFNAMDYKGAIEAFDKALTVRAHAFSAAAKAKIEAAGGRIESLGG